ncbi:MAG: hypothetical protein H0T92_06565 [Pyrinomonadaceae bacterium]|nr:hypothetical protein [Pyrinomonadaceae bacterium]
METNASELLSREHEQLGQAVIRLIVEHARTLDEVRVCSEATPADLEKIFDEPLPVVSSNAEDILARFARDILPHAMQIASPRYYGLFNPTPLPIAVWADALSSAINQNGAAWRNSPSASIIEARVLRWLCTLIGYGEESFGTLTSGGSEANLVALKCARDHAGEMVRTQGLRAVASSKKAFIVYASKQCHYSLEKSVDILGLGRESLRTIATDDCFHIRISALREEIEHDLAEGNTPLCIVGVAGATSTGVVDPLGELADIAEQYELWFHVDAAYGGALAFSEKYKERLRGIERARSITIDPHKWMFVPFACGAVLVRDGAKVLRDAFDITPEYLSEDRGGADTASDFFRYGQLGTRRFNALKLWMALKCMGIRGYSEVVERHIELTHYFAQRIDELKDFERIGPIETAVCCFRFLPEEVRCLNETEHDRWQRALQQRVERSGAAWLATTVLHGRRALRVNINSFLTEQRHIDDLVELLRRESQELMTERKA